MWKSVWISLPGLNGVTSHYVDVSITVHDMVTGNDMTFYSDRPQHISEFSWVNLIKFQSIYTIEKIEIWKANNSWGVNRSKESKERPSLNRHNRWVEPLRSINQTLLWLYFIWLLIQWCVCDGGGGAWSDGQQTWNTEPDNTLSSLVFNYSL